LYPISEDFFGYLILRVAQCRSKGSAKLAKRFEFLQMQVAKCVSILYLTTDFKAIKYKVTEQGPENFDNLFRGFVGGFALNPIS